MKAPLTANRYASVYITGSATCIMALVKKSGWTAINYNNDLSEFWEWLDSGEMSLHEATLSLKFGVNYVMYAMTH